MNIINEFLKRPVIQEPHLTTIDKQELGELNTLFQQNVGASPSFLRIFPEVKQNQIWTIKKDYLDYEGKHKKLNHPMMVLLTCDCENLDSEAQFVRGCPISPFIELAADDDQICNDPSIVGFPFIVEVWNEQPMLIDILDKYVEEYYADVRDTECALNKEQQTFREIEISNARYLNQTVIAYLQEMERTENFSFSVDVSMADYVKTKHMPRLNMGTPKLIELPTGQEYASAAKLGNILTDNDCIDFNTDRLPFNIEVRKKAVEYILTIKPNVDVCLKNDSEMVINGTSNSERIVFPNLKKGLYTLTTPLISDTITIRLK